MNTRMRGDGKYTLIGFHAAVLVTAFFIFSCGTRPGPPLPRGIVATAEKTGPASIYPEDSRTPGAVNPDITQANIAQNICNPKWSTRKIRPPASYTDKLKRTQMRDWGLPGKPGDYEEDHFISLELGGNPTDPRNLWPEAYAPKPGAREKDVVENYLHKQVCSGALTLEAAQKAITADWYKVYAGIPR